MTVQHTISKQKILYIRHFNENNNKTTSYTRSYDVHLFTNVSIYIVGAGIAQSVLRLATGWTVRGSNPSGGEIFCTHADRPWGPPSLLYNG
jgi:hypothetical protein